MIEARDASGCSAERHLGDLAREGPPFLFASESVIEVGFQFKIGEQPFTVRRMCSRAEFEERQRVLGSTILNIQARSYFEAATD